MNSSEAANRPAANLAGQTLPGGWCLDQEVSSYQGRTGANFCVGYLGHRESESVFIKVIDIFGSVNLGGDLVQALYRVTQEIEAERATLLDCRNRNLSRIVEIKDSGDYAVPRFNGAIEGRVFYFVFERAEGDIRRSLTISRNVGVAWKLSVLRDVALGVHQLAQEGIAHQDIKPSNVLVISGGQTHAVSKLADLGRAIRKHAAGPHDALVFPGDHRYAPLSAHYGLRENEWSNGRTGTDMYMLGLLQCFLFSGVNITERQLSAVPKAYHPTSGQASFQDALPHLKRVHSQVLRGLEESFPEKFRDELRRIAIELTTPDPFARGDKRARARVGSPPGTEVYVSRFSALAKRAELGARL